jgi:hypothetical protein
MKYIIGKLEVSLGPGQKIIFYSLIALRIFSENVIELLCTIKR